MKHLLPICMVIVISITSCGNKSTKEDSFKTETLEMEEVVEELDSTSEVLNEELEFIRHDVDSLVEEILNEETE